MIPPPRAYPVMFVLIVRQHGATQRHPLPEGRTIVGRGAHSDIVINDDSISRQHARLEVRADQVVVSDLQSRNGTYVAGAAVHEATLHGGELLSFGDVEASLERGEDDVAAGVTNPEHTIFRRLG